MASIRTQGPANNSTTGSLLREAVSIVLPLTAQPEPRGGSGAPSRRLELPSPDKAERPGYRCAIRLRTDGRTVDGARSSSHAVASALRVLDGANGVRPARVIRRRGFDRALRERHPGGNGSPTLTAEELALLFHLPVPGTPLLMAPPRIAPPPLPQRAGKVICLSEDPDRRPVVLSQADSLQHVHVLGPTGSGKSSLLTSMILDDVRAGRGVGVIDPNKGDLVRAVLERIPNSERGRVILIDPARRDLPVGINILECSDPEEAELLSDSVVSIFRRHFEQFWGPRTDDVLRSAILTLLLHGDATLCEVPLLLQQPRARARYLSGLDDPIGLGSFWRQYDDISDSQRQQVIGPVLNKLRAFLLRRTVRNMLGQPRSTVDLGAAMDSGGIVLVSLAKGTLGEETGRLLGSFILARAWQEVQRRADRPEDQRRDFNWYLDEFPDYLSLSRSLDEVLVEARGYRVGLVLAHQHIGQLRGSTRDALMANGRTRIVFQCGADDARALAHEFEPQLGARQLQELQERQVAVRLCEGRHTLPPFTGITPDVPPSLGEEHGRSIAEASLARHGRSRATVEADLIARLRDRGFAFTEGRSTDEGPV